MLWQRLSREKKKSGCFFQTPDSYKGWVSKHNPITILISFFLTKKISWDFFFDVEKLLTTQTSGNYPHQAHTRKNGWNSFFIITTLSILLLRKSHCLLSIENYQSLSVFTGMPFSFCILSCSFFSSSRSAFSSCSACCWDSLLCCGCGRCCSLS